MRNEHSPITVAEFTNIVGPEKLAEATTTIHLYFKNQLSQRKFEEKMKSISNLSNTEKQHIEQEQQQIKHFEIKTAEEAAETVIFGENATKTKIKTHKKNKQ